MELKFRNGFQYSPDNPHLRFKGGSPKPPKPPKPPDPSPSPVPREAHEEAKRKDEERRRQRITSRGRGGTILNEGTSLSSGGATILGRSTK